MKIFNSLCKVAITTNFDQKIFNPFCSEYEKGVFILIYKMFQAIKERETESQREIERDRESLKVCKRFYCF